MKSSSMLSYNKQTTKFSFQTRRALQNLDWRLNAWVNLLSHLSPTSRANTCDNEPLNRWLPLAMKLFKAWRMRRINTTMEVMWETSIKNRKRCCHETGNKSRKRREVGCSITENRHTSPCKRMKEIIIGHEHKADMSGHKRVCESLMTWWRTISSIGGSVL